MTPAVRRLLSVAVVAVVVAVGVGAFLHGGRGDDRPLPTPAPGPSETSTNLPGQPDVAVLKARAGVRDCAPGPGGGSLPDVTVQCLGGGTPIDLDTLRGPMLLSFWQAGCKPCLKEMPALQAFDQAHGSAVPVLGVDFLDQYPGSALQLMRSTGATYPSVADPLGDLQQFAPFARVVGLPVLMFIDGRGDIAYEHPGGVDSETEIADLVQQHLGVDL